jgi:glycosyltransferase involved in cell wall biosynthesis
VTAAPVVSLIVATINRVTELERLLASLDIQSYKDFEVIVIDQNADNRLLPVFQGHPALTIRHLRSRRGAGRARNVGLRIAAGSIICFPDDDCWYPAPLLESVVAWLDQHRDTDAIFTTIRSADDLPVGPRWPPQPCQVTKANLWNTALFVNVFMKRKATDAVGYFREDIGVGAATPYQSGEESDYFLRALALGFTMQYEPSYTVHHPDLHNITRLRNTTYGYSLGCGYVMRIHGYSWPKFAGYVARSLGGAVFSLGKGDISMSYVYILRAAGQLRGYVLGPRDLNRAANLQAN